MKKLTSSICPICKSSSHQRFVERKWEFSIFKCSDCTVQYTIPFHSDSDDKRIKMGYRRRLELVGGYIGWSHRRFFELNIKPGGSILEIGCGTGDFVALSRQKGYKAIGVDLDKEAIEVGKNHWKTDNLYAITAEEYFDQHHGEKFDIVCFFAVLEHLNQPHEFMIEVKKYLKPDGYVVLEVPNGGSTLQAIYRKLSGVIDYPPQHLTRWTAKSLKVFLSLHNFKIVHYDTCIPTITDIIFDLIKLHSPRFLSAQRMIMLNDLIIKILFPFDWLVKRFTKNGRSHMVIATLENNIH